MMVVAIFCITCMAPKNRKDLRISPKSAVTYLTDIAQGRKDKVTRNLRIGRWIWLVALGQTRELAEDTGAPRQLREHRSAQRFYDITNLPEALGIPNQPNSRRLL